jgi:AcrR family transcriptional regulator
MSKKETRKISSAVATTDRKKSILQTAEKLFLTQGYEKTSVNQIVEKAGVAKGTFYHHFKTKEDILSVIADDFLSSLVHSAEDVANDNKLSAGEKMKKIFSNKNDEKANVMKEGLHHPQNRKLHEEINVQLILRFSPILVTVIEQGVKEGQFKVKNILETVQFLLTASQFLFDEDLFDWNTEEWSVRRQVMQNVMEMALGAKKGSFKFISGY